MLIRERDYSGNRTATHHTWYGRMYNFVCTVLYGYSIICIISAFSRSACRPGVPGARPRRKLPLPRPILIYLERTCRCSGPVCDWLPTEALSDHGPPALRGSVLVTLGMGFGIIAAGQRLRSGPIEAAEFVFSAPSRRQSRSSSAAVEGESSRPAQARGGIFNVRSCLGFERVSIIGLSLS